jgi:hypothetical protein
MTLVKTKKIGSLLVNLSYDDRDRDAVAAAYNDRGSLAAEVTAHDNYEVLAITGAYSYERRGARAGTRLYEVMAEFACERGLTLASDELRTENSEGFWHKQYQKGRAVYETASGGRWKPSKPKESERDRIEDAAWGATRYRLKSCPAPANLEGLKRRRRRRR